MEGERDTLPPHLSACLSPTDRPSYVVVELWRECTRSCCEASVPPPRPSAAIGFLKKIGAPFPPSSIRCPSHPDRPTRRGKSRAFQLLHPARVRRVGPIPTPPLPLPFAGGESQRDLRGAKEGGRDGYRSSSSGMRPGEGGEREWCMLLPSSRPMEECDSPLPRPPAADR